MLAGLFIASPSVMPQGKPCRLARPLVTVALVNPTYLCTLARVWGLILQPAERTREGPPIGSLTVRAWASSRRPSSWTILVTLDRGAPPRAVGDDEWVME